ncbi:glycosyltransferase family 4 protein [Halodesulfovibrio sp. MK-HDV]|jgi:glycosyltransferase involved in cell wall biosynthesis|uniref:glycosyltransferase family 4 protein n=1 Tax=Halodesulfovibrio sp. MK-HDV TaxID=2599925 RepID=UPI001369BAB8|nr:glycosyltransferase family 4 protein [Halodesulfovibrio sp. MK-HDV]KAF1077388.1 N,N'-diacetylbacillosaminyl-diphospho-undecaprenol alpha-1,3-N-acetylgalactosaminyltransferase [Halodesulfovibrio sp. MK-HDV]
MKKVMIVGGEDLSLRLPYMQQLVESNFSITAVGSQDEKAFVASGIPYIKYALNRWVNPLDDLKTIFQLRKIIIQVQPDIVHGFDTKPALYSLCASMFLPVKAGRTINGTGQIFSEASFKNKILRYVFWLLQTIFSWKSAFTIFQNSYDKAMFEAVPTINNSQNFLIQGSGIDCNSLPVKKDYKSNIKQIILVSRMLKNKGIYEFLQAARSIKKKYKNCRFLLIGPLSTEGEYAVPIKDIESYSADVEYLGQRSDVKNIMFLSDLMVLPTSYREGVPRVLLEAGGIGLPLLTTDMPGCSDLVTNGENGWLVAPQRVDELTESLESFLTTSSEELKRMGQVNVALVRDKYSMEVVLAKSIAVYSSLF